MALNGYSSKKRPPLPSYEEATQLLNRRTYSSASTSSCSSTGRNAHVRTGSDRSSGSLRSMRYSSASELSSHRDSLRSNGSGTLDSGPRDRTQRRIRFVDSIPEKPARKFPPILENSGQMSGNGGVCGSCGEFLDKEPHRAVMGSSPNLASSLSSPRQRHSCVSLDDEKLNPTTEELLRYRQLLGYTRLVGSSDQLGASTKSPSFEPLSRKPPIRSGCSMEKETKGSLGSRGSRELIRPSSISIPLPRGATGIRTNGSLHHLMQVLPSHSQSHGTITETDTSPTDLHRMVSVNNNLGERDNLSVSSVNSGGSGTQSESDSGKATSHNSGDAGSQEDALYVIDDYSNGGGLLSASQCKGNDGWKMLPEVSRIPWNQRDISAVLQSGRLQPFYHSDQLCSPDLLPYISHLLKFLLLRICLEISRLSHSNHDRCTKRDVLFAIQRILSFSLYTSCKNVCQQATAFYATSLSGDQSRSAKSVHAGLVVDVGKVHGFMVEKRLAGFVHDLASVCLTAVLQTVVEELVLVCVKELSPSQPLSVFVLEKRVLNDAEFFGIFQTWRHLQAGRTVGGHSALPAFLPPTSSHQILSTNFRTVSDLICAISEGCDAVENSRKDRILGKNSSDELTIHQMHWSSAALSSLHFFLASSDSTDSECSNKELTPPLIEWLRIIEACGAYRRSTMIEKDDVMEAARILLPSVDYPPHLLSLNDELQYFQAISKARLLNEINQVGLTPLMVACIRSDYHNARTLMAAGAKVNIPVPSVISHARHTHTRVQPDTQNWTALHFAVAHQSLNIAKCLLDGGALVEGAEGPMIASETPLQIAAACGFEENVQLLVNKGADPCLSSLSERPSFSADAQRGTHPALVLAAAHGRRNILLRMLTSLTSPSDDTISLEEILEETNRTSKKTSTPARMDGILSKQQNRVLQVALYHAAENGFLDCVFDLLHFGGLWKPYIWMRAVTLLGPPPSLRSAIRDVMEVYWSFPSEDLIDSPMFSVPVFSALLDLCQTCHSQSQPHLLQMIANVICHIYGREFPVPVAKDAPVQNTWNRGRFVLNDRATADVLLRIQGTNVYAHSYVLGKASVKLGEWLEKGQKQGAVTVVEVADGSLSAKEFVRVMQLVYGGGNYSSNGMTEVEALALIPVARYLALPELMQLCEKLCWNSVTLDCVFQLYGDAKRAGAYRLLEYCEGFILQNFSELITRDSTRLMQIVSMDISSLGRLARVLDERVKARRLTKRCVRVCL